MITKQEVLDLAGEWSLGPQVVEKDYVIGWLLAAIYQHQRLDRGLVFKGGTCLKKCYLETYRFSEDLDFTVSDPELLNEQALKETFSEVAERIYESTGIEIRVEESRFDVFNNPRGRRACQGCFTIEDLSKSVAVVRESSWTSPPTSSSLPSRSQYRFLIRILTRRIR